MPPDLLIVNPRYALLAQDAFASQSAIGWKNFYRGYISTDWKRIQYRYLRELNRGDIHAVDKWARMLTSNILEFTRIIWNERCSIVAAERDTSYDGRKRKQLWTLCSYLKRNTHLLPPHKTHVIQKEEHYFQ